MRARRGLACAARLAAPPPSTHTIGRVMMSANSHRHRFSLEGRHAVVTGAGSGLGHAIALGLAEAGATVVAADLRPDAAEAVAEELRGLGATAQANELDVTDSTAVESFFAKVSERKGLDILV